MPQLGFLVFAVALVASLVSFVGTLRPEATAPLKRRITQVITLTLLLIAAFGFRVGFEHQFRSNEVLAEAVNSDESRSWDAIVTSSATHTDTGFGAQYSFEASLTQFEGGNTLHQTAIPVRVSTSVPEADRFVIGEKVRLIGDARFNEISTQTVLNLNAHSVESLERPVFLSAMDATREHLRDSSSRLEGWAAELIPGLAVGDTELVSNELNSAMKTAALTHLTAVSGANCAIITGLVMFLGLKLGLRKWVRITLSLGFLALFVVLVTPEPSVLRAAVMTVVTMIALLSNRQGAAVAALSAAMIILLLLDPWQAVHFGFVLSVLATAGILLFSRPLTSFLHRVMPVWLATVIAVPLAAQIACQPAIILLQPTLPLYGLVANIVAAPAAPVATLVGLAACLTLAVNQQIGDILVWLTWWPASWISETARFFSGLPAAQLPWISGWFGAVLLAVISLTVVLAFMTRRATAASRRVSLTAAVISMSVLFSFAVVRPLMSWASIPKDWQVFTCDVGQGDGLLVRGSGGVMLIDTGIDPNKIDSCLDTASVSTIDLLVLTHDDKDHVGGLSGIVNRVKRAIVSPPLDNAARPSVEILERMRVPVSIGSRGISGNLGDLRWQVVWPDSRVHQSTTNDSSVVMQVDLPSLTLLALGDLGEEKQQEMLRAVFVQRVDMVKVSHHGSADQSALLYQRIAATYGLISVGAANSYGHPTEKTLRMLRNSQTLPLRTDELGSIAIMRSHDGKWRIWSEAKVG